MLNNVITRIRSFAKDQGGMEAIQAVALVAIGAMILIAAINLGTKASGFADKQLDGLESKAAVLAGDDAASPTPTGVAEQAQQNTESQGPAAAGDAGAATP